MKPPLAASRYTRPSLPSPLLQRRRGNPGRFSRNVVDGVMAFLLCVSAGCDRSATPTTAAPKLEKPRVALVMKSLANEFFSTMAEGAKKHQATNAAAYDLIVNGIKNETDLAEQVNLV